MTTNPRYPSARPAEVGPHDVKEEQNDPQAKGQVPEKAYNNEIEGQVAATGKGRPPAGKDAPEG